MDQQAPRYARTFRSARKQSGIALNLPRRLAEFTNCRSSTRPVADRHSDRGACRRDHPATSTGKTAGNGSKKKRKIAMFDAQCDLAALVYERTRPDQVLREFASDLKPALSRGGLVQLGHHCVDTRNCRDARPYRRGIAAVPESRGLCDRLPVDVAS